jgi:D-3-phosphoglycerate dehydrogenase
MLAPGDVAHAQRVAHFHHNTPGVLAHLNQILAEHDINIEAQVLATRGALGYVVTDTNSLVSAEVLSDLGSLAETVRLRVID